MFQHCMKCCKAAEENVGVIVIASLCFCRRNFSDMLPRLAPAFEVDPLLKRTFLHTIPVWKLNEIVGSKMFFISDICVALVTFCSREFVPFDKVRILFENVLRTIP